MSLKLVKRRTPTLGKGVVFFNSKIFREAPVITMIKRGPIKRIRGIVYSTTASKDTNILIVKTVKNILTTYVSDVFIFSEKLSGSISRVSQEFGITLVAETENGCYLSAEILSNDSERYYSGPEEVGKSVVETLLWEIYKAGTIDSSHQ